MKKSVVAIAISLIAVLLAPLPTNATPKSAAKCTKKGKIQVSKGYEFTCIKKGGKLIWIRSKEKISLPSPTPTPEISTSPSPSASATPLPSVSPSAIPEPAPTPIPMPTKDPRDWNSVRSTDDGYIHEFNGFCDKEEDLIGSLRLLQEAYLKATKCSGIYRIAKYQLGNIRPSTQLTSGNQDLPVSQCKLSEPRNSNSLRGFPNLWEQGRIEYFNATKIPGPKMVVQIVPISASDTAKSKGTPESDYRFYTDFVADWVRYSTDGESKVEFRFPNEYLKFSGNVGDYKINHDNNHNHPEHQRFVRDLVAEVDAQIDFTNANFIVVLVPPGTPLSKFQQGTLKNFNTNEGLIRAGTTEYPFTLEDLNSVKYSNFLIPFWWLHELFHSGVGLDDHYGDSKFQIGGEYGLGQWTLMTPWGGDLSAWEKWILGYTADSQVHCVSGNSSTTKWIVPSSVKSSEKKLIVIPISQSKGIIIESIRAAGLYYKIPKESEGVLVYEANLEVQGHGLGLKLVLPTNRDPNKLPFFLSQAPLRLGESVVSNGIRISILESGTFGDVVRVEKS